MKPSGLADSPFFAVTQPKAPPTSPPPSAASNSRQKAAQPRARPKSPVTEKPHNRDTMPPRHHDTTAAWYRDTIIELVRKAVKELGKEAATHRFTSEEKKALADVIYAYTGRGVRTSENEITRIAVNFILSDYRENGENGLLDRVLKALNE
jgi:hypothetical protein